MTAADQAPTETDRTAPWEQLPGEPGRDHLRFLTYLTLPDRRQSRAAPALGISEQHLKDIRARWQWMDRAGAYDRDQAEQLLATTARLRTEATAAVLQGVLETAEALLRLPDEARDPRALQSLAAALRSLSPATEVAVSAPAETGPDVIEVAFRRAQQMRAGVS